MWVGEAVQLDGDYHVQPCIPRSAVSHLYLQTTFGVWVINIPCKYGALVGDVYLETVSFLGSG